MFPVLFQVGDFVLTSWHVFFVVAAFVAWSVLQFLRSQVVPELSAATVDRLFVFLYVAGYFGARIFSILTEDNVQSLPDFYRELTRFGAMTLYGGVIAVSLGLITFAYRRGISLSRLATLFAAPGLIAIGIGRIGCFLNGDDFGKALLNQSHPPFWAVKFPNLGDEVYRYPVQLWEAGFTILFGFALVVWMRSQKRYAFGVADAGVVGYTIVRFILEFYRGDERGQFFGTALSTSQGISLALLAIWIVYRSLFLIKNRQV